MQCVGSKGKSNRKLISLLRAVQLSWSSRVARRGANGWEVVAKTDEEAKSRGKCASNGIKEEQLHSEKALQACIEDELLDMGIVFSHPIRRNESQPISLKAAKDVALSKEEESADANSNTETQSAAAKFLCKSILSCSRWGFHSGCLSPGRVQISAWC